MVEVPRIAMVRVWFWILGLTWPFWVLPFLVVYALYCSNLGILRPIGVRALPLRCLDISPLGFFLFIQSLVGFLSPTPNLLYHLPKFFYKTFIAYQTKKKRG